MIRPTNTPEIPSGVSSNQYFDYGIRRTNKAHTATANRIARSLGTAVNDGPGFDIQLDDVTVEVETTASMLEAEVRLADLPGKVYIAMTNKDGVSEALSATRGSRVGIMDPHGKIVRECQ